MRGRRLSLGGAVAGSVAVVFALGLGPAVAATSHGLKPYVSYPAPAAPSSVLVADVTGDGRADVLVAGGSSQSIFLFAGRADGTLGTPTSLPVASNPSALFVRDVNGDGRPDVVVLCAQHSSGRSTVDVLIGRGGGAFAAAAAYPTVGQEAVGAAMGDVNGDGLADVVTADTGSAQVSVLLGRADGTFGAATAYPVGSKPQAVALDDTTGSGHLDVVTADTGDDTVSVLRGRGDGTFAARSPFPTGSEPESVAVADVTGDGRRDILTADYGSDAISVLAGDGAGSYAARVVHPLGGAPRALTVGDVTGDQVPDVVAVEDSAHLDVLAGQNGGGLAAPISYPVEGTPLGVAVGDVDDDGNLDALSVSYAKNTVDVLTQDASPRSRPTVTTAPPAARSATAPPSRPLEASGRAAPGTATPPSVTAAASAVGTAPGIGPAPAVPVPSAGVTAAPAGAPGGGQAAPARPPATSTRAFTSSLESPSGLTLRQTARDSLLGLLLLGLLALPVVVVNDTAASNADRLAAMTARARERIRIRDRRRGDRPSRTRLPDWQRLGLLARLGTATALGAVLYAGTQPHVGLDLDTLELVLGLALTILLVAVAQELTRIAWLRRAGLPASLRLYPGFGAVALVCLVLTRSTGLQPGLLLGKLSSVDRGPRPSPRAEAQGLALGCAVLAALSTVAWAVRGTVASAAGHGFVGTVLQVALTGTVAAGVEALLFGMLPLEHLYGLKVFQWSRWAWAGLVLYGAVGFVHVVLGAHDDARHVEPLVVLLAVYLMLASAFWAALRKPRAPEPDGGSAGQEATAPSDTAAPGSGDGRPARPRPRFGPRH